METQNEKIVDGHTLKQNSDGRWQCDCPTFAEGNSCKHLWRVATAGELRQLVVRRARYGALPGG